MFPIPSRTSRRVSQTIPDLLKVPPTRPGPHRGSPVPYHTSPRVTDLSRTSPRVPRPVLDLPEGPTTRPGPFLGSPDPSRTAPRVL